ncbi:pectate lyase family protein [Dyadobacter chenhuakuii]|uniref:Polysaccharide lyase n=1 Tax=Dyadobacter chenhuakuii TaxID=2909339 RepID=A0ABY4XND8_9BACT|nr:polysaccharide lyase [Dyadobacter chenhuakuii]MCF2494715.1 polysaccharide lyase [Dyadobacter chenhuakuii]USJ31964.1 polysaccharide lyase [Dyadobacter chenhuakuii]
MISKKSISLQLLTAALSILAPAAQAQYPKIPPAAQKTSDSLLKAAMWKSEIAWQKAWPVIEQEARNGKPYIPWAARPVDLPQSDIPAFPGAEGGGAYSFGGRGGKVYVVKSLEDSGPGTLRDACEQGGARIIVFNVAGIIRLKTPLIIRAPYITIAGQTAPGDGVCVAGETVWINTHDVVIRHMRFRRGETFVGRRDDSIGGNPIGNIMIDHVSASWGLDENMSMYRHMYNDSTGAAEAKLPTVNITIQNSIFSETLDTWNHSFGSTLGGENCTFMRNLWANNAGRNPSIGWFGIFNFTNNVVFNWVHRSIDGGDYRAMYNIINNYFKPGPQTPKDGPIAHRIVKPEAGRSKLGYQVYGRAYVHGNIMEGFDAVTKDNWNGGVQVEELPNTGKYKDKMKWNQPLPMPQFPIMSAKESFDYVLTHAGATLPRRDPVDTRVTTQVRTGKINPIDGVTLPKTQFEHRRLPIDSYKNGIITDISQVGGYPEYKGTPYKDSDDDGMPDDWEIKYSLNPNDASDAQKDMSGDGYANIEKFINGIDPKKKTNWKDPKNNRDTLASSKETTNRK